MPSILSEFQNLPQPTFEANETIRFYDLAPADAERYAQQFLELRKETWSTTLVASEVVGAQTVAELYDPTRENVKAQIKYMHDPSARNHYVAVTKNATSPNLYTSLIGIGRIGSLAEPRIIDAHDADIQLHAFDVLPKYQQRSGVGTLVLSELLGIYDYRRQHERDNNMIPPYSRNFFTSVRESDKVLLNWMTSLGAEVTKNGAPREHVICVGGVLQVRDKLRAKLAQSGYYDQVQPTK